VAAWSGRRWLGLAMTSWSGRWDERRSWAGRRRLGMTERDPAFITDRRRLVPPVLPCPSQIVPPPPSPDHHLSELPRRERDGEDTDPAWRREKRREKLGSEIGGVAGGVGWANPAGRRGLGLAARSGWRGLPVYCSVSVRLNLGFGFGLMIGILSAVTHTILKLIIGSNRLICRSSNGGQKQGCFCHNRIEDALAHPSSTQRATQPTRTVSP
jgi:hypothetical protein